MNKEHWRGLMHNPNLGSWDLETDGQYMPKVVTIKGFANGELVGSMGKEQKVFVSFHEFAKPMVMNKTNFKRLETRFGTFEYKKYVGQQVLLTVEKEKDPQNRGQKCDALRFSARPIPPHLLAPQEPQKKTITDERLTQAIEAIKDVANEKMTKEALLKSYQLTKEQTEKLDKEC